MTVKTIYSNNVFYSNDEMSARGSNIDVQEIVESPELYLLGKTSDKLEEKLTYTETRMEDIVQLSTPLEIDGKILYDELRFFTGKINICYCNFGVTKKFSIPIQNLHEYM